MKLLDATLLSDGTSIPAGITVTAHVTGKRTTGDQPPLLQLEADTIDVAGRTVPIEVNPVSFYMRRPSSVGSVVKGSVIGAAAGAVVGILLKKPLIGAAAGAAVGAGAGAATASHEACVSPSETRFSFIVTKDVILP